MITIIAKGTLADIAAAAATHAVYVTDETEIHPNEWRAVAIPFNSDPDRFPALLSHVAAWFAEPSEAPFPNGTLLYYWTEGT